MGCQGVMGEGAEGSRVMGQMGYQMGGRTRSKMWDGMSWEVRYKMSNCRSDGKSIKKSDWKRGRASEGEGVKREVSREVSKDV